jgi:hypothetical protein
VLVDDSLVVDCFGDALRRRQSGELLRDGAGPDRDGAGPDREECGAGRAEVQFREERSAALQLAGEVVLTVQRTGDLAGRVWVRYATADGSARAGEHYQAQAGELVLEAWQASEGS